MVDIENHQSFQSSPQHLDAKSWCVSQPLYFPEIKIPYKAKFRMLNLLVIQSLNDQLLDNHFKVA